MATEVEARLEARADNLAALDREALNKTTHGIAARIAAASLPSSSARVGLLSI